MKFSDITNSNPTNSLRAGIYGSGRVKLPNPLTQTQRNPSRFPKKWELEWTNPT